MARGRTEHTCSNGDNKSFDTVESVACGVGGH